MKSWILSVVGVSIVSVLCDVIMPEGHMRKYVRTFVSLVVTLTLLLPIVSLYTPNSNLFDYANEQSVDGELTDKCEALRLRLKLLGIESRVNADNGCICVTCDEDANEALIEEYARSLFGDYEIMVIGK